MIIEGVSNVGDNMEVRYDQPTAVPLPMMSLQPTRDLKIPHALISIALEENNDFLGVDEVARWLRHYPRLAKYVPVQGVYKGQSTLLICSIPLMV